jgi:hypothetical protein
MSSPFAASPNAPARDAQVVTPSDSTNIPVCRSLWIGGTGGDIKVRTVAGTDIVFSGVPIGSVLPVQVIRVWSTGTSCTSINALY